MSVEVVNAFGERLREFNRLAANYVETMNFVESNRKKEEQSRRLREQQEAEANVLLEKCIHLMRAMGGEAIIVALRELALLNANSDRSVLLDFEGLEAKERYSPKEDDVPW